MRTARESYVGMMRKLAEKIATIGSDQRGASALEFAIFVGILAFGLLNTADISIHFTSGCRLRMLPRWLSRRLAKRAIQSQLLATVALA